MTDSGSGRPDSPPGANSTDRSAAAARLLLSPERYRVIFNNANLGIVSTNIEGFFIEANPAFCRMLGYPREDLLGRNIAEVTYPEDLPGNLEQRRQMMAGDTTNEIFEKRYIHKDGHLIWARLVGSPISDDDGELVGLFAMVEDITARKESERELARVEAQRAESEKRLQYITQATLDLVWDWDLEAKQIWWGEGLDTLLGFTPEEVGVDGKFWLQHIHPDDRPKVIKAFEGALFGDSGGWHLQYQIRNAAGEYIHLDERATVFRNDAGKAVRVVAGNSNISRQVELEEKLRQALRLESLGQLTGGVAHDFNNLLTVMLGNAELLSLELGDQPRLNELASTIARAALQGADLTHRLLAFARRQALEPRTINLNHLVDNMGRILERTLGATIRLRLCPDNQLALCHVDPNQLESAILNLALNARDAMPGGGKLTIETGNFTYDGQAADESFDLAAGDYVCLAVSDTGEGIPHEHLEHVLEPFFTTKEKGKGTGLGLSTTFGFIKQSGGHMTLYSEPGDGTTVRIYLPQSTDGEEQDYRRDAGTAKAQPGYEKILLVEDDDLVRRYAETQLVSLGYRVVSAANGQEALDFFALHEDFDLLFTDVVMPGGMDGTELAARLRAVRPDLKVLYTSGYTENHIIHNGQLDAGVQLLGKPYQRVELAARLREILDSPVSDGA